MKLPLTLAIIPSLIVKAEDRRFAVPQVGLEEVVRIRVHDIAKKVERIQNSEVLRLRGTLLPLVRLAEVLGLTPTFVDPDTKERAPERRTRWSDRRDTADESREAMEGDEGAERRGGSADRRTSVSNAIKIIVLRTEKNQFGLIVDDVLDNEEIVVKPLPEYLKESVCYAGATIMGDGKVAMILDPNGIAAMANLKFDSLKKDMEEERKRQEREAHKTVDTMLLFTLGARERFAVDIASVARIEKRTLEEIEIVGDKEFLKYDTTSLRLFRLERFLPVQAPQQSGSTLFIIVPKGASNPVGIVTSKVEDAVQTSLALEKHSVHGRGIRGSAIINKKMTVILDMADLMKVFEPEFTN
jgi:two-component system chemotaxis sensor kinase CheA